MMASTREMLKVQESESRSAWISCVSGSDEELPHMVPEQIAEVVVIVVVVFVGVVGVAVVVGVVVVSVEYNLYFYPILYSPFPPSKVTSWFQFV